jgi:hypothetical protein
MIKLKDLISEAPISQLEVKLYWNFVLNAISGKNPDAYYRQYQQQIDSMALALVTKYGPNIGGIAYRGIILDDTDVHNGKVNHDSNITYTSFSEDKSIAIAFADTDNPMWEFGKQRYPDKKGYLITDKWKPQDLIFHHKWLTDANMWKVLEHFFDENVKYIKMQKELILKPKPTYDVEPIAPGTSGGLEVGK